MSGRFDLEDRTLAFAKNVRDFVRGIPKDLPNLEYSRQLIRSSGSVGANYIEANEALSRKDFLMRIRICRKEAKETRYWLDLVTTGTVKPETQEVLLQESKELLLIFNAILKNTLKSAEEPQSPDA